MWKVATDDFGAIVTDEAKARKVLQLFCTVPLAFHPVSKGFVALTNDGELYGTIQPWRKSEGPAREFTVVRGTIGYAMITFDGDKVLFDGKEISK